MFYRLKWMSAEVEKRIFPTGGFGVVGNGGTLRRSLHGYEPCNQDGRHGFVFWLRTLPMLKPENRGAWQVADGKFFYDRRGR